MTDLEREIRAVLNQHSAENGSNTADFILAEYLVRCLDAFNEAVNARDKWYGVDLHPGHHYREEPPKEGEARIDRTGRRP